MPFRFAAPQDLNIAKRHVIWSKRLTTNTIIAEQNEHDTCGLTMRFATEKTFQLPRCNIAKLSLHQLRQTSITHTTDLGSQATCAHHRPCNGAIANSRPPDLTGCFSRASIASKIAAGSRPALLVRAPVEEVFPTRFLPSTFSQTRVFSDQDVPKWLVRP